ncbi:MAG: argininosuccinate lyase [Thermoplasmatales archaeon]|nr:argininosuccinate lyase [Thermoplasmatales archaeon]
MKLWQQKYQLNKQIEAFTVGNDYLLDQKLVKYDCLGSIAHVKMLNKIGILDKTESDKLTMALYEIIKLDGNKAFIIKQEDEDCHTAIENFLIKKLGDCGKKIHTARSRNDQVLTALRLFYKDEIKCITELMDNLIKTLVAIKQKYGSVEIPGYTHMQKAMPSSVGLWAEAFAESMNDNKLLLLDIFKLVDQSPLGTGAGYGLPIEVDRETIAECLGFSKIQKNPIYVQNSRGKFESTILHGLSQIMFDLNKMASDLLLFSIPELGYFQLPTEFCTGSSIMPHKKNPDVLEIIRAKYHQIVAFEFEIKNNIANLISGYNRDIQLTKKPVICGFEVTKNTIQIMIKVLAQLKVNKIKCKNAMTKELYATDKVYKIIKKGVPFREAYKEISQEYETT